MKVSSRRAMIGGNASATRVNGFTLIELLVVIAIIAILAAILFPVFAQAREKARQTTCLSNEKQMGLALLQYKQDFDEAFPMFQYTDANGQPYDWQLAIYPYVKNGTTSTYNGSTYVYGVGGIWSCPSFPTSQAAEYGGNYSLFPGGSGTYQWTSGGGGPSFIATDSQIQSPADSIEVVEKGQASIVTGATYTYATGIFDPGQWNFAGWLNAVNGVPTIPQTQHLELAYDFDCGLNSTASNCQTWGTSPGDMPRFRHTGTCNALYCDGHAKAIVRGQINWYKNIYIQGLYEKANGAVY